MVSGEFFELFFGFCLWIFMIDNKDFFEYLEGGKEIEEWGWWVFVKIFVGWG